MKNLFYSQKSRIRKVNTNRISVKSIYSALKSFALKIIYPKILNHQYLKTIHMSLRTLYSLDDDLLSLTKYNFGIAPFNPGDFHTCILVKITKGAAPCKTANRIFKPSNSIFS